MDGMYVRQRMNAELYLHTNDMGLTFRVESRFWRQDVGHRLPRKEWLSATSGNMLGLGLLTVPYTVPYARI